MRTVLSALEARVIACLIEKEITTPELYPLSLHGLLNACNQKSNRDPVLRLDESQLQATIDDLMRRHLVLEKTGFGSRVPKFQQRFCNSDFGELKLTPQELALVCELLLRGPQTPGELRAHADRMYKFADVTEVERCLSDLGQRDDGPLVVRLAREPGKREARYAQLFTELTLPLDDSDASVASAPINHKVRDKASVSERIETLETCVRELREELDNIKEQLGISARAE